MLNNNTGGVQATTANRTYYVRKDGSDSNTGLVDSAGGAFLTITKARSIIAQMCNHTITIIVGAGTYAEDLIFNGFSGSGYIFLQAAVPNTVSDSYIVQSVTLDQCSIYVEVNSIKANKATDIGFNASRCQSANFLYCKIDAIGAFFGFNFSTSDGQVSNSVISNRSQAIRSDLMSTVYSSTNSGTGNTLGLVTAGASKIGKNGTQATATTPETNSGGGEIL